MFNFFSTPVSVLVVGTLLARGFISFFTHFLMHKMPMLWRLHRVHHLDTELDVSSTVRFHPFEFLAALPLGVPVVVIFGLSPWVLLLYEVFDAVVTLFSHANIRLPASVDRALRYIIVTPDLHRVHHSSWQPETDSNYSAVFPIWDIIFGTFRTDTRLPHETMELGLEEVRDKRAHGFLWLLGSPFRGQLRAQPRRDVMIIKDTQAQRVRTPKSCYGLSANCVKWKLYPKNRTMIPITRFNLKGISQTVKGTVDKLFIGC